ETNPLVAVAKNTRFKSTLAGMPLLLAAHVRPESTVRKIVLLVPTAKPVLKVTEPSSMKWSERRCWLVGTPVTNCQLESGGVRTPGAGVAGRGVGVTKTTGAGGTGVGVGVAIGCEMGEATGEAP